MFTNDDQHFLLCASGMVLFGSSDDLVELMSSASELEDKVASDDDAPTADEPSDVHPQCDSELICVPTKAASKLGLQWSYLVEPEHSRLDKCFR